MSFICLHFGAQPIAYSEILRVFLDAMNRKGIDDGTADVASTILLQVRMPRMLLGFLVGCSLATVGVALQALLRNPLADPYVLGVSSGAALGAAVGVLLGAGATFLAETALPVCGFAGGLLALVIVYRMAASSEQLPIHSLLLTGVILNAIFSALIMFITSILEPNRSYGMMAWLMGTLTAPTYGSLAGLVVYLVDRPCPPVRSNAGIEHFGVGRGIRSHSRYRYGTGKAVDLCLGGTGDRSGCVGQRNDRIYRHGRSPCRYVWSQARTTGCFFPRQRWWAAPFLWVPIRLRGP